jgi:hypothetical protein
MPMEQLQRKIISSFEQKMANLRGLRGLKIREMRKFVKANMMIQSGRADSRIDPLESETVVFEKCLDEI